MKLIYYSCEKGNVGDELNSWLWPKIFGPDFIEKNEDTAFLGIGSILIENSDYIHDANQYDKKIVCGTGVRSFREEIPIDSSWYISFLRGPFSSVRFAHTEGNYITDGAYFIALLDNYQHYLKTEKKYKVSVIPYYQSMHKIDWEAVCDSLGYHLISPETSDVDHFIKEVAASELVIAEAMHGAILADVLRVPWKRFRFFSHTFEGEKVSEFKWTDWLFSIGIYENKWLEVSYKPIARYKRIISFYYEKKYQKKTAQKLAKHESLSIQLSDDVRFNEIVSQLKMKKQELKEYLNLR